MKILSIRIKNLASLEGITEIDFTQEPLSSAGIFAITGATGAGKSTILDALCLALYCKTPRYLQAKESGIEIADVQGSTISQGDVRGILRDGTSEGFAEVDFAGVDKQCYRATWQVRRARGKADGSLQQYSLTLKNIDTNTDIPGKKNELQEKIEELVGLNFEQFTRSVLLAQGDFTAFLKAPKDEKSALLEKLTGTHIYSVISKQVFVNYSRENRELEDLNLQLGNIAILAAEELEALILQKETLEQSLAAQEKEAELLNKEIAWHTQLAILSAHLSEAHAVQEQAIEARKNAAVREQELKQVEQVQPTRTWMDGQQSVEQQLAEKTVMLQEWQSTLDGLQQQQKTLEIRLQTAIEEVAAHIKKQEAAIPLLEEARALDIQISEKTEQLNRAADEAKEAEDKYQQQNQQLQLQQQEADQLLSSITQLQQWKKDNNSRQPVAEHYGVISSKLSDARTLLNVLQSLLPQLESTQNAIAEAKQEKADLEATSTVIAQQLQTGKEQHTTVSEALAAIAITSLQEEKAAIDLRIEDMISAQAGWNILFQCTSDLAALKEKLDKNKSDLNDKEQSLDGISGQLIIATAERDGSLRILDKARLAAADNVAALRSQLVPEEACPVCGSTHHPYSAEHPPFDHLLEELEATHREIEQTYTGLLRAESSVQETITHLKETITQQEQETSTKEITLATHQKTWEGFTIYPELTDLPDDEKAAWLAQQLKGEKKKQKKLQQQIQSYAEKKQEFDAIQLKINDLDRHQNENGNAVKDTDRQLQSLQEQWAHYNKEQQGQNKALATIEQNLSAYFADAGWFAHWKNDPETFLEHTSESVETWKTNIQTLEQDSRQHSVLTATLEALKGQLQSALLDVQKKQATLATVKEQQDTLTQKRETLFNGEAAATIEQELKQAVAAAQQALEKIKSEFEQLQTTRTRTDTQKEQAEQDIKSLQQQAKSFKQKIQEWLSSFNSKNTPAIDAERLLQLLAYDTDWIETERAALKTIDDAIIQAHSIVQERNTQLLQHEQQRLSERSAEALNELLNTVKTNLQQQVQQKNEIGFQLQQDLANKQKIGDLQGVIEAKRQITENWARLNDVIGSADGKKFRHIAQEYTLDVLLSYANVHLGMLSNRYLLQRIPHTLALQVVDKDMGDEIRTVYSLSGGESFLVSLALALGLASLSSSRMQVESLFIDEGFGSLDPDTLNIAMDALERLHNQGRKVGVISHVQEMTERIPVQIKVSKQQSGKSKVEVVGV